MRRVMNKRSSCCLFALSRMAIVGLAVGNEKYEVVGRGLDGSVFHCTVGCVLFFVFLCVLALCLVNFRGPARPAMIYPDCMYSTYLTVSSTQITFRN
jgi:hypothetical protein